MIVFIVVECGLGDRIGTCHVDLPRVYSVGILGQIVYFTVLGEGEVLLVIIFFAVLALETGLVDRFIDIVGIGICGVLNGNAVVRDAVEGAVRRSHRRMIGTVDVVNVLTGKDLAGIVGRSAEVDDDRIPFKRFIDKIGTDASDIADPVKTLPILQNAHLTAHVAFFHDLIEYVDSVETILGLCLFVDGVHNGQRALLKELFVHDLAGQRASGKLGLGFRLGFGLGNRGCRHLNNCCIGSGCLG